MAESSYMWIRLISCLLLFNFAMLFTEDITNPHDISTDQHTEGLLCFGEPEHACPTPSHETSSHEHKAPHFGHVQFVLSATAIEIPLVIHLSIKNTLYRFILKTTSREILLPPPITV